MRGTKHSHAVVVLGWLFLLLGACGGDDGRPGGEAGSGITVGAGTDTDAEETADAGGTGASSGVDTEGDTAADANIVEIRIEPADPFIEVIDGEIPPPLALTAIGVTDEGDEIELGGVWNVQDLDVVSVDNTTGDVRASGIAGGVATVDFSSTSGLASTDVTVKLHITENDGSVDPTVFGGAATPDPSMVVSYPYDETVFPLDLVGPVVQWEGAAPTDAFYLHLTAPTFEYEAWFTGYDPAQPGGRYPFPTAPVDVWSKLTRSVAGGDIDVELQRHDGSVAYQPIESSWHIADATLIGTIYYWEVNNGNVVRLKVGDPAPEAFLEKPAGVDCIACHSVSADGSRLVASFNGGESPWGTFQAADGSSLYATNNPSGFQAISPEGDYVVWGQVPGSATLSTFDSNVGLATLPMPAGGYPAFPAWSPDGDKLAYTVRTDGNWLDFNSSSLWVSDVDTVTPQFTADHQLVAPTASRTAVTYPTWSPDSEWIAYGRATQARTRGALGELGLTNVDGTNQVALERACGVGSLASDQSSACYEPTFMPESRGGYFWLVFVSERTYGNTLTDTATATRRKQLWVTAIEDPPPPGQDPSHPAFWLPGQELDNHNMRGAWTLEPPEVEG